MQARVRKPVLSGTQDHLAHVQTRLSTERAQQRGHVLAVAVPVRKYLRRGVRLKPANPNFHRHVAHLIPHPLVQTPEFFTPGCRSAGQAFYELADRLIGLHLRLNQVPVPLPHVAPRFHPRRRDGKPGRTLAQRRHAELRFQGRHVPCRPDVRGPEPFRRLPDLGFHVHPVDLVVHVPLGGRNQLEAGKQNRVVRLEDPRVPERKVADGHRVAVLENATHLDVGKGKDLGALVRVPDVLGVQADVENVF